MDENKTASTQDENIDEAFSVSTIFDYIKELFDFLIKLITHQLPELR